MYFTDVFAPVSNLSYTHVNLSYFIFMYSSGSCIYVKAMKGLKGGPHNQGFRSQGFYLIPMFKSIMHLYLSIHLQPAQLVYIISFIENTA